MSLRNLFKTKPLHALLSDTEEQKLQRHLGPLQLTFLGVGAIIGAGIFSMVGSAAAGGAGHTGAGPAIAVSFMIVAVACGFAALCYAEFASLVPVSGSAYTYAYATLGELVAWIIGWDLIIEYAVGNVAVAISWSAYFQELLRGLGLEWPNWLGIDYRTASQAALRMNEPGIDPATLGITINRAAAAYAAAPRIAGVPILFNIPAFAIVIALTVILVRGIRESANFNTSMVVLKLAVVALFIGVGAFYVTPDHWTPFAPNGFPGITSAAAIIFFAYIGFDAVSTAAEETKNPQRNMPIGILASLVLCTVIYIAVAIVLTGMVDWRQLATPEPLATAFATRNLNWMAGIISFGAVFATTSVLLVFALGQPRIFFSMARDGLLPQWAARVHPKYRTPHVTTILTGVVVALFAGRSNLDEVVELTNIGTLFAFVIVAAGVIVLRLKHPHQQRSFRVPFFPIVPLGAILCCGWLMTELPRTTWMRFLAWLGAGLLIYFAYGFWRSKLRSPSRKGTANPQP